jgi:negative regulator of sigma E activity
MTHDEAQALLGFDGEASLSQVHQRYQTLYNEYQIRLTNAPTQSLRRTYQRALQDLREACELLAPGISARGEDLPASEPALQIEPTRFEPAQNETSSSERAEPFPRSTILVGVIACILLAIATGVGLMWARERSARTAALVAATQHQQRVAQLESVVSRMDAMFSEERLRVRNRSRETARILAAAVVYYGSDATLRVAHSGSYGYPTWELKPDDVAQIESGLGRGRDWDGRVLSYALLIEYPGAEPFVKTGVWAMDLDRLDKTLPLLLD